MLVLGYLLNLKAYLCTWNNKIMKKRKYKYIRFFTFLGLIAVLSLQSIWIYNTYTLIKIDICKDCCEIVAEAIEKEMEIRMEYLPEGTQVVGGEMNGDINPLAYFSENLSKMGHKMSIMKVDSITSVLLKKSDIDDRFFINLINPQTNSVLQKSKKEDFPILGRIKSEPFLIKTDSSEAVQLILINPYITFFERMGLLMIASFVMLVLVVGCIIYQIKVIIHQRKVAKLREDFSYAMIHDMKTPLSALTMCSEVLGSERIESMPDLRKDFCRTLKAESGHLLKLVNRVLNISKLENHKMIMDKETVWLQPMLERITDTFKVKSVRPVYFILDLRIKEVNADKVHLEESLYNLIDNAIKYSKDEGDIKITISTEGDEAYSCIKVCDNGIGISKKDIQKIFDKFERGSAFNNARLGKVAGFGLGLNYVYQVAEAHGGMVTVNSVVGKYSEFAIYIPILMKDYTENNEKYGEQD